MKSFIPHLFTLANLASGLLGITAMFSGDYILAAYFVGASLGFDFLDGFAARLLHVNSDLGIQLDSLADVVSFGVVPGFLMYHVLDASLMDMEGWGAYLPYLGFLVPLFSAYRLAKFNIDTRQTDHFIGMPTPANAIWLFAVGLLAFYTESEGVKSFLMHPVFLSVLIVASSILLVAELPLISFKVQSPKWQKIKAPVILALSSLVLLAILGLVGFVFIIPLYLLLSLIFKPNRE